MSKSKPTNSLLEYRKADSKTEEELINIIKPIISGVFLNDDYDHDFALGYLSVYHLVGTYNKADTIKEILIDVATTYFGTETIDLNGVSYLKKVLCVYDMMCVCIILGFI